MVFDHSGLFHMHKRKRQTRKLDPFPHPNHKIKFIDDIIYFFAIIIPLMTIPQIWVIWVNKSAQDMSLITWGAFLVSAFVWLIYSIVHKDKPLIINSVLWVILESLVVIGIIIFR